MPGDEIPSTGDDASTKRRTFIKAIGTTGVGGTVALAGCTARGQRGPNTIQIAANSDIKDNVDKIQQQLRKAGMPEDITIDAIAGAASSGERKQQYSRWLSADLEEPSLLMMDSGWTIPFILGKQLTNLSKRTPELAKTVKNEYYESLAETAMGPNGDVYGVPLFPDTGSIQYRKDLVKKAGFSPDEEGWATNPLTWQKFSKVAKATMQETNTKWGFSFQAAAYEGLSCCDFKEFTATWGASYFGARKNLFGPVNERPVTVDTQPVVDATRMVRTFIKGDSKNQLDAVEGDIAPRAVLQWEEETSREPFTNGDVVMHRNWPYSIAINGAKDAFGKDLGVMPMPYAVSEKDAKFDGYGGSMSALGGWHMCLNPNSKKKDRALEVLKAMMAPSFQLFLFELLGWMPPRPALFESKKAKQVPVMGRYLDTLRFTVENSVPRPVSVAWPQQSTKIAQAANAAFSGDSTPKQSMKSLQNQLKQIEEASARNPDSSGNDSRLVRSDAIERATGHRDDAPAGGGN